MTETTNNPVSNPAGVKVDVTKREWDVLQALASRPNAMVWFTDDGWRLCVGDRYERVTRPLLERLDAKGLIAPPPGFRKFPVWDVYKITPRGLTVVSPVPTKGQPDAK